MTATREKILQKVNPKLLKMTPKLSAGNGMFINLDSDDSLEDGAKDLLMRYYRNQEKIKRKASEDEVELTVTSARYNDGDEICEILSERLKIPCSKNEDEKLFDKPGKNLQKLKMELQEKISAKWEEEYKKRVKGNRLNKIYKKSKHRKKKYVDEENESDKDFDPNACSEDEQGSSEDDGCEGDVEDEEEEVEDSLTNDATSATETNDEPLSEVVPFKSSAKEVEFEDMESCSLPPAYQPGGGLLYGGSELTQCDDEDLPQSLLSPSLKFSVPESPQCKSLNDSTPNGKETIMAEEFINSFSVRNKLFSQNPSDCFDLNDAYEFCSGKFPDETTNSQSKTQTTTQVFNSASGDVSQDEEVDKNENKEKVDDSQDKITDVFSDSGDKLEAASKPGNGPKIRKNIITFDDSEDEEENSQPEVEKDCEVSKILSDDEEAGDGIRKKRRKNLQFSDEEDENGEDEKEETSSDQEEEDIGSNKEEIEEEEVDSDKEEEEEVDEKDEERSVQYDSEENEILNPREFFEKEAELSGSEWSVDEDERGLDEFDREEGDADVLDDDQVRSQLEKIHLRQVLDEDAREVRLLKEILFEDGDLYTDGKGRDRKFRWKNLGKSFEETEEPDKKEEEGNSSEDEGAEEEQRRKLRHEKALFLMEKKKNGDENLDEEILQDFQSVRVTSVKSSLKVSGTGSSKLVLDHTEIGRQVTLSKPRGSFLTRNEEFLSSLAKVSSSISDNMLGPKHSKNFVFATKSPEKVEQNKSTAWKRQVDDAEIRGSRRDKKFKFLPPEVDTGPSILDLLV